jgi:hypothetical protein
VSLVLGNEGPLNAVTLKEPKLVWQKCVRLHGLVRRFASDVRVVRRLRFHRGHNREGSEQQQAQTGWEQRAFHFLSLRFLPEFFAYKSGKQSSAEGSSNVFRPCVDKSGRLSSQGQNRCGAKNFE